MTTEALAVTTTDPAPADAVFADPVSACRTSKREWGYRGGWQTCSDNLERVLAGRPPRRSGMRLPNIHSGSAAMGAEERLRATR
jgi:hypothetical protein